ncbi:MAG TPA: CocE/NonD family hydrolase [Actinomycetota bacterium]
MAARTIRGLLGALIVGATLLAPTTSHAAPEDVVIQSNAPDQIDIALTVFKPDGASESSPAPVILQSHGWGGSRATSGMTTWLDAGIGVVSFDQRGHGDTGGEANVEDPELEGYDVEAVIDYVASLDWVALDGPGDPKLGAIGGSYGGGYQTIGALSEILHHGDTRFNALAPEITWYDLNESLAPQGVVRTIWVTGLYAVAPSHPQWMDVAFAQGAASGQYPGHDDEVPALEDLYARFYEHSPRAFADDGIKLDIPVLQRQGVTDDLFNLNQGLHIFQDVLTDDARADSLFIGYNGGHVLAPEVVPPASVPSGDPCSAASGGFTALSIAFYQKVFAGESPQSLLEHQYNIATNDNGCIRANSLDFYGASPAGVDGVVATTTTSGAPVAYELAEGPISVAGIPLISGNLTTVGVDARAFFALSVGTSPADATVIQNNVMPIRSLLPVVNEPIERELPAVAVDVPVGQSLFLTVSPFSSGHGGHASRTPGAITITDAFVSLPIAS